MELNLTIFRMHLHFSLWRIGDADWDDDEGVSMEDPCPVEDITPAQDETPYWGCTVVVDDYYD